MKRSLTGLLSIAGVVAALALPVAAQASQCHTRASQINGRLENQHDRIQQGNRSGELNRHEDYSLRTRDARVRLQEDSFLARHGRITNAEDSRLNHELNRDSRAIYRDKHNDRF